MKKKLIMLAIAIALYSQPALAQKIYKWVDDKGTTHFTDYMPETVKSSVNPENVATQKGDELARQRILKEAAQQSKLKLPETSYYDSHPEEKNQSNVTLKKPVDIERKLRQMKSVQQQAIFDTENKMRNMQNEMERKIDSQKSEMMFQKMDIENQIRMSEDRSRW